MDIRIRTRDPRTAAAANHARQRVFFSLMHRQNDVDRVDVKLDVADPASPRNRYCLVHVRLAGGRGATVVSVDRDLYGAIDCAAERAGRLITGQIAAHHRALAGSGDRSAARTQGAA